jgi:hypothetical protein
MTQELNLPVKEYTYKNVIRPIGRFAMLVMFPATVVMVPRLLNIHTSDVNFRMYGISCVLVGVLVFSVRSRGIHSRKRLLSVLMPTGLIVFVLVLCTLFVDLLPWCRRY